MKMIFSQEKTLILIIDVQEKLLRATFNKEILEKNSKIIVNAASALDLPIFVTEQYPQGLGESIEGIKDNAQCFAKTDFNALADKNLLDSIKATGKSQIIVFGIETHICVHQTVDSLLAEGFDVAVVSDACGSRSEIEYNRALGVMEKAGAMVKTTEMILFELLKSAKHPCFKQIQALIK